MMYSWRTNKGWHWLSPTVRRVLLHCDSLTHNAVCALQFYSLRFVQKIIIHTFGMKVIYPPSWSTGLRSGQFTPEMPVVKHAPMHAVIEPAVLSSDMPASICSTTVCWQIKFFAVCHDGSFPMGFVQSLVAGVSVRRNNPLQSGLN